MEDCVAKALIPRATQPRLAPLAIVRMLLARYRRILHGKPGVLHCQDKLVLVEGFQKIAGF